MEFIDWQPGNGTRYPIALWSGNLVDLDYMADKMGINSYDCQGLATFLYTKGIKAQLGHWQKWDHFQRAEELGFDKLLLAS